MHIPCALSAEKEKRDTRDREKKKKILIAMKTYRISCRKNLQS
jgi:hypothetical protein